MSNKGAAAEVFNLLSERWIPVLWADGRWERVGILEALREAGRIRQIAASNPMDRVALLRFLMAIVYWYERGWTDPGRRQELLAAGQFSGECLERLQEDEAAFELLGAGKRFLQDNSLKGEQRPYIGDLLVEFPGHGSVNHSRHVLHGSYGLCPACCAMGILRFSVWAPANSFFPASVNPGSAAYAIATEANLMRSLVANSVDGARQTVQPPWLSDLPPRAPLGPSSALAWRPRRLCLGDAAEDGRCAYCGYCRRLIKTLAFSAGWATPQTESQAFAKMVEHNLKQLGYRVKDKKVAKALKAARVIVQCRLGELPERYTAGLRQSLDAADTNERKAIAVAAVLDAVLKQNSELFDKLVKKATKEEAEKIGTEKQKKFWDEDPLLLQKVEPVSLPGLAADVGAHAKFWRTAFSAHARRSGQHKAVAIGPVVNQFACHDAICVSLPDASTEPQAKISDDIADELLELLRATTANPTLWHSEIRSALTLLTPATEARIRKVLAKHDALPDDKEFLRSTFRPVLDHVVASTRGSAFQRRLALQSACDRFERLIWKKTKTRACKATRSKAGTV